MAHDDVPFSDREPRARRESRSIWIVRIGSALAAIGLLAIVLPSLMVEPWWARSGFPHDPGFFVRKLTVDYPVCAPWGGATLRKPRGFGVASGTVQPLPSLRQTVSVGILLPSQARVAAVYCGSTSRAGQLAECSSEGCDAAVTFQLDDELYTHGRAITVSLVGKSAAVRPEKRFQVWVIWRTSGIRQPVSDPA